MQPVVTEIHKRKYVSGLLWQSLSRPRELRSEAVDLARKLNFDLMVFRKDLGVAQAGFASSREGVHKGMLSLGAIVASVLAVKGIPQDGVHQPAASWLGAFRLTDDRWAYLAVRDESFLPGGDFAGSRTEVLERLYADYGMGGWNAVIGEAELQDQGFHNFFAATIGDFLPRSSRNRLWLASAWELVPIERSRHTAAALAGLAVVLVSASAAWLWHRQRMAEEALLRERALQTAQQRRAAEQAKATVPPPWPSKPSPRAFARACQDQFELIAPGGWHLDEYICSESKATHAWSRGDSLVAYLLEQAPDAVVELSGEKARLSKPLPPLAGVNEELLPASDLLVRLLSRFQEMGLRLAVKPPQPASQPAALPGMRSFAAPAADWHTHGFSVEAGGVPLMDIASALSQPGVRMSTLTYRQGSWSVEGVAYAK